MKNKFKKLIAMLLVVCMMFSFSSVALASFAPGETINYVSIGDSMSNGYCFDGYEQGNGPDKIDFLEKDEDVDGIYGYTAYPNQFEAYLEDKYHTDVKHTKLALSAERAEDLYYLLGGREEPTDGWQDQVNGYSEVRDDDLLKEHFQTAVKEADIITMGIGNASFGAYMLHRVTDALGVFGASLDDDEIVDLEEALIDLDEEQKQLVLDIYDKMMSKLVEKVPAELAEEFNLQQITDIVAYTVAGFLVNFKGSLETILELNPDVEIILLGLLNTTYGMQITGEDMDTIYIGDIMDELFDMLNAYIAGVGAYYGGVEFEKGKVAKIYYAEQPEPKFICQEFARLMEANWKTIESGTGTLSGAIVRSRNIDAYNDTLRGVIGEAVNADKPEGHRALAYITPAMVAEFETNYAYISNEEIGWGYATEYAGSMFGSNLSADQLLSIAIYLGIEKAVAESTDTLEIPLEGLKTIATNITSVFSGLNFDEMGTTPATVYTGLASYLTTGDVLPGMCKIYALFKVGNGMSVHPTPEGHDEIFASVVEAYETNHTVQVETLNNLYELVKEYYDEAYAYAYAKAVAEGRIDAAVAALEAAIAANAAAAEIAANAVVPAELADTQAALVAELGAVNATLTKLYDYIDKGVFAQADEDALKALLSFEEDLGAHIANIEALAAALDVVVDDCVADMNEALNILADAADALVLEAYNYLNESAIETKEAYLAWVEEVGAAVDTIDAELGAAVRQFLIEAPADTCAILYAYGEEAIVKLVGDAVVVSGDVALAVANLMDVLSVYGEVIYDAVKESAENGEIKALVDAINVQLALAKETVAWMQTYYTTATLEAIALKEEALDIALGQIVYLYNELSDVAFALINDVDPVAAAALSEALDTLNEVLAIVGESADGYLNWLAAHGAAMGAELLCALLANVEELLTTACPIVDEIIIIALAKIDAAILEFLPVADQYMYDWLYNNPDKVDAFFTEYGYVFTAVAEEYGAEAAAILAYIGVTFGPDAVDYVLENPKESIELFVKWYQTYGYRIWPILHVYMDYYGICQCENIDDIYAELRTYGEEYAKALIACVNGLIAEFEEELAAADEAIKAHIAEKIEELKAFAKELAINLLDKAEDLANEALDALIESLPYIDEYLYNYFYNNPDEVIAFFENYGEYFAEYLDELVAVLGYIGYTFGEDALDYVLAHPMETLDAFVKWYEKYGERTWAMIHVYADALGLCQCENIDEILADLTNFGTESLAAIVELLKDQIDVLEDHIAEKIAEQIEYIEALVAEIEAMIAEMEAQLEAAIAEAIAKAEAAADAAKKEACAMLEKAYEEYLAAKAEIEAKIEQLKNAAEELEDQITNAATELNAKIEAAIAELQAKLTALIENYKAELYDATHVVYDTCPENHTYVSLGGAVAYGDGLGKNDAIYAELFAEYLDENVEIVELIDCTDADLDINGLAAYIMANAEAIASADIITYNLDAAGILDAVLAGDEFVNNWAAYASAEDVAKADEIIAEINKLLAEKYDPTIITLAEDLVETVVYATVAFGVESYKALETISAINPEATVLAIGMYNPFAGMTVTVNGEVMPIGDYFDYAIEATNLYYELYAIASDNFTFVEADEAEVAAEIEIVIEDGMDYLALVRQLMGANAAMLATAEGHEYIAECIADAIIFEGHNFVYIETVDPTYTAKGFDIYECTKCGAIEYRNFTDVLPLPINPSAPVIPVAPEKYECDGGENCPCRRFTDLDPTAWYHYGVDYMILKGIMIGVGDGQFAPHKAITRAEVAQMLWRLEGCPEATVELNFSDVAADAWYTEAVRWAVESETFLGYGDGTFGPNDIITREQLAAVMFRYAAECDVDVTAEKALADFTDADTVSAWAVDSLEWAYAVEMMIGTGDGKMNPLGDATRATIATVFHRYIENILKLVLEDVK